MIGLILTFGIPFLVFMYFMMRDLYCPYDDLCEKVNVFLCCFCISTIFSFIIGLLGVMILSSITTERTETETFNYELVGMDYQEKGDSLLSGSYCIHVNDENDEENSFYCYYYKDDDDTLLKTENEMEVSYFYGEGVPYVEIVVEKQITRSIVYDIEVDSVKSTTYTLHIPKGTLVEISANLYERY